MSTALAIGYVPLIAPAASLVVRDPAPALLFRVPDDELAEFWNDLDDAQQRFVNDTFSAIEEIHAAANKKQKAIEIADRCPGVGGFSVKILLAKERLYTAGGWKSGVKKEGNFYRAGDWKALVPDYWLSEKKWHPDFIKFLARIAGGYQRDQADTAALRDLKRQWESGDHVDGYGTWRHEFARRFRGEPVPPHCPPDFYPAGWSDRNLRRLLPKADHMALVRHGVAAMEDFSPQILNDRTKLYFGQIIIIDDFWAPFKVVYKRGIDYCMGLAAMDWASGAWLHHALMPREKLPDGTRTSLTASHMQWFIIGLLRGALRALPRDRTITLLVENNTASVSTDCEELIKLTFNGRVLIRRSGLITEKQGRVLGHGFRETGGKWRAEGKGNVESGFNLIKNEMSGLPGQRGSKERTNGHAALPDTEKYAVNTLQNQALTEQHVAMLKLPFLTYEDALILVRQIFDRVNGYRDHKCRGFLQVTEWRLSEKDQWTRYGTLPTPEQQALLDAGAEMITRTKPESRAMRAQRLHAELEWVTIADSAFIPLSADRFKPVTVTAKKQIKIGRTGEDDWFFYSAAGVRDGLLVPGKEYRGFIFGEDGDSIHLTPKDSLDYLGTIPRWRGVDPTSETEKAAAYAQTVSQKNAVIARVREVHAPDEAELAAMRLRNTDVAAAAAAGRDMLAGAAAARVETKKQSNAQLRRNARRAEQLAASAEAQLKDA